MGSQTPSRTYWTPTMERFFLDLMLEHMRKGNRIGHTFNKQAWADMLAVFNAKFGSQYDKDVLKSRYTNLWKQFNDIKNILGQNGFSWDDTQQMVMADDNIWDAYIKVHPDAKSYKAKPVLNFDDLCLIYGYTVPDGRYSRSSHDIDIDDEGQGVNAGDGCGSLTPSNSERSRTDWTPAMDQYLIELMLNQQQRGNKLDTTFNKQAWTDMLTLFNANYGPQHSKRVLRHRFKKLWKYYNDIVVLLKQNGFSWDETRQMVAADDDVWDAYIRAYPHARTYRMKILPNFNYLQLIFGDAINNAVQSDLHQGKSLVEDSIHSKAGHERSRTCWTPPMDHYLIDLLLDQVHKGNKIGQTFITRAWIDMVRSFNKNFGSHYEKDVLKNRYKHLRRQYNDVKILLEQTGFSWDETLEMVRAEDHVWDAYTKEHPDARSYRVKTVPSYDKLCVIHGLDNLTGRYSHLAHNAGLDSGTPFTMVGERNVDPSLASTDPLLDWTPAMEHCLIDLMLQQVDKGSKTDIVFDEQTWVHIGASFNEKFGLQCDKYVLENQYLSLMKQCIDISSLLNQNGFSWDETGQVVAADDSLWEAYIKERPDAISYKGKILAHYADLCILFGGSGLTIEPLITQSLEPEFNNNVAGVEIADVCMDLQTQVTEIKASYEGKKRPIREPSSPERLRKVQKDGTEDVQEALANMEKVVRDLVNRKVDKNSTTIESAIDTLQAIPDIDDDLLLDACDLLEDERKAKTFLALDASLRKKWLLRKLGR